jgi:hypothetical protein
MCTMFIGFAKPDSITTKQNPNNTQKELNLFSFQFM